MDLGFILQYCLLVMLEKFKEAIEKGNQFEPLLTDLSKTFDCINQKLLIAKFYEYGVSLSSFNTISSYLRQWAEQTKINDCFSATSNTEYGVPQGSVLGTLHFKINMIDLFYGRKKMISQTMLITQLPIYVLLTFLLASLNLKKNFLLVWQ